MNITADTNIVLIGMPGAGKSTIGVLLAKYLSRPFLDTDITIQAGEKRRLQNIIDENGLAFFLELEERYLSDIRVKGYVIATGGSAVYSEKAMDCLTASGIIVYLQVPLNSLKKRALHLDRRGVVMAPSQNLDGLYEERAPLYAKYSQLSINCADLSHEGVVRRVAESLSIRTSGKF